MRKMQKSSRLRSAWDGIRTSFWFVPSIMMVGAIGLWALGFWLDMYFAGREAQSVPWWVYVSGPDEARNVLSTLLSSMITMTSLVFSITMVVLSLAASQFGPRLIRNFMASPQTQMVLGTFVMTILYCLMVLAAIGWQGSEGISAFSTITIAIVLMAVSVALLVLFIHTLARSIVSETVIERVGRELDDILDEIEPLPSRVLQDDPEHALPKDFEQRSVCFGPDVSGYIQVIEFDQLVETGRSCDIMIVLHFKPGDYLAKGGRSIAIYPREHDSSTLREKILDAIVIGAHRTPVQDPEFSIRHLVEIGARALSPGVNDPYTAVAVVHRLSASLSHLMGRALPPGVFRDKSGVVRVVCQRPSYASLMETAFDQIRQNGADKPLVVIHLLEALARIAEHVRLPAQAAVLAKQLRTIEEDAEREIASPSDRADVKVRAEKAREIVVGALARGRQHAAQG
jgi:uncharacterized membrane protein